MPGRLRLLQLEFRKHGCFKQPSLNKALSVQGQSREKSSSSWGAYPRELQ